MAAEALDVGTQLAGLKSLLTTPGPVILEVCINPFFAPGHEWCALPVTGAGGAEGHPPAATPAASQQAPAGRSYCWLRPVPGRAE